LVAAQAEFRALSRAVGWVKAEILHQQIVLRETGRMRPEPFSAAAVTDLAADAIGKVKLYATQLWRNVVAMAVQTYLRLFGGPNAEIGGNPLPQRALQRGICASVLVIALPCQIFVL